MDGYIRALVPENFQQRHVRQLATRILAWENKIPARRPEGLRSLQDIERRIRQRHDMGIPRLHSLCRNGPELLLEVDLTPTAAANFTGSPRCQNEEFKCEPINRDALAQPPDKSRNVLDGKCREVPPLLGLTRQAARDRTHRRFRL